MRRGGIVPVSYTHLDVYKRQQEENVNLKHLIFWGLPSIVAKLEREVSCQRYRLQGRSLSKRLEHTRTGFTIIEIDQCEK